MSRTPSLGLAWIKLKRHGKSIGEDQREVDGKNWYKGRLCLWCGHFGNSNFEGGWDNDDMIDMFGNVFSVAETVACLRSRVLISPQIRMKHVYATNTSSTTFYVTGNNGSAEGYGTWASILANYTSSTQSHFLQDRPAAAAGHGRSQQAVWAYTAVAEACHWVVQICVT